MADARAAMDGDRTLAYATLAPSFFLLVLLAAVPTVTVFATAMQDVGMGDMSGPYVGFENFAWALESQAFYTALWNTFVWVFGSVAIEMIFGLGLALLLNKTFLFRGVARAVILAPYLVPTVVAVLVWRYMFHDIVGIINAGLITVGVIDKPLLWLNSQSLAMTSVILVGVWKFFPFVVIALLGILQSIPQEQYEAAKIDGASGFQQFWRITLPYVMPVFLLTALLRTIWSFHKFEIIYLMTGGGPLDATTTLPILVYLKAFSDFEFGRGAAVAILTFTILIVFLGLYFLLIKRAEAHQ
ncbi:carbohydrate ABC transporter permease [Microvirga pudoricolor]|uniref:carbohydrate ABC transporter permease n=1 Tax=Microvirga pudoricolor TaxID=2778729 RepID=UPI0019521C0D|nr:sugar ABC transporter permease [Microvirga pudoricolor]MBM6593572.1 sugar ABC transporter permease [Microvirga pudoricolor]